MRPASFALWSYRQLQEIDRRRHFMARLDRLEAALLTHYAVCAPERLESYERDVIASAAKPVERDDLLARATALVRDIQAGGVLTNLAGALDA